MLEICDYRRAIGAVLEQAGIDVAMRDRTTGAWVVYIPC